MAYYRGDYYRGDYYRGDYYRGDPFALPLIAGLGRVASKAIPALVRGAVKGAKAIFTKPGVATAATVAGTGVTIASSLPQAPTPNLPMNIAPPQQPGIGLPGPYRMQPKYMLPGGTPGIVNETVPRGYHINKAALKGKPFKNYVVKNRSMNVTNPRALRRAIRRGQGFLKLARRFISFYSPKAPKGKAYFRKKR